MTRLALLGLVSAAFAALNVYVVGQYGYVGFFTEVLASSAGVAVAVDLAIALTLAALWMLGDAAERALPVWPYLLLTVALGSLGPLGYLIHRELRSLRAAPGRRATA